MFRLPRVFRRAPRVGWAVRVLRCRFETARLDAPKTHAAPDALDVMKSQQAQYTDFLHVKPRRASHGDQTLAGVFDAERTCVVLRNWNRECRSCVPASKLRLDALRGVPKFRHVDIVPASRLGARHGSFHTYRFEWTLQALGRAVAALVGPLIFKYMLFLFSFLFASLSDLKPQMVPRAALSVGFF